MWFSYGRKEERIKINSRYQRSFAPTGLYSRRTARCLHQAYTVGFTHHHESPAALLSAVGELIICRYAHATAAFSCKQADLDCRSARLLAR